MITTLKIKKAVNVSVSSSGKFTIAGMESTFSIKDIPAIRYNFDTYGTEEFNTIENCYKTFTHSLHLVEVNLMKHNISDIYEKLTAMNIKFAYLVHIDITDAHEETHSFSDIELNLLKGLSLVPVDRLMLTDKSTSLDRLGYNDLRMIASKESGIKLDKIGICSSPLTQHDDCCLSAVVERELAARYASIDAVLPSANHQNDNDCCKCLRYIVVSTDIMASGKTQTKSEKTKPKASVEKAPKKKKFPKGAVRGW